MGITGLYAFAGDLKARRFSIASPDYGKQAIPWSNPTPSIAEKLVDCNLATPGAFNYSVTESEKDAQELRQPDVGPESTMRRKA